MCRIDPDVVISQQWKEITNQWWDIAIQLADKLANELADQGVEFERALDYAHDRFGI